MDTQVVWDNHEVSTYTLPVKCQHTIVWAGRKIESYFIFNEIDSSGRLIGNKVGQNGLIIGRSIILAEGSTLYLNKRSFKIIPIRSPEEVDVEEFL